MRVTPGEISLNHLLTEAKLTQYEAVLNEAGLVEVDDIVGAEDSEMLGHGLKMAEVKRLRRITVRFGLA